MVDYFLLGLNHVLDFEAFDHMLFICIMLVSFTFTDWKKVLTLVTAFTVGHSITLAVSVLYKPLISSEIVEFAIPLTIMFTAILALIRKENASSIQGTYVLVLVFGFIHGMGFANYLNFLLPEGDGFGSLLLMFNLGIEIAQIIVAALFLSLMSLLRLASKSTIRNAQKLISVVTILISLFLATQNFPF